MHGRVMFPGNVSHYAWSNDTDGLVTIIADVRAQRATRGMDAALSVPSNAPLAQSVQGCASNENMCELSLQE